MKDNCAMIIVAYEVKKLEMGSWELV